MVFRIFVAVWMFLSATYVAAQHRDDFWSKANLTYELNKKWSVGTDIQYRRQANYRANDHFIFRLPSAATVRFWVYYKLPKDWQVMVSPFAYFNSTDVLNASGGLNSLGEARFSGGATKTYKLGKVSNKNRMLLEFRHLRWLTEESFWQQRFRFQNSFTIPIIKISEKQQLNILTFNELHFRRQAQKMEFDQNRTYIGLQLKYGKHDISAAYQHTFQKGSADIFRRNTLLTTVNFNF